MEQFIPVFLRPEKQTAVLWVDAADLHLMTLCHRSRWHGLAAPGKRENYGDEYTGIYDEVQFGYGGFLTEYYFNPKDLVVFSIGTLIGGGGLYFSQDNEDDEDDHNEGGDNFFVIEPELNVFIHVTRFCIVGAGVSYRYVNGINSEGMDDKDFRGPAASAMVQFGWF